MTYACPTCARTHEVRGVFLSALTGSNLTHACDCGRTNRLEQGRVTHSWPTPQLTRGKPHDYRLPEDYVAQFDD